MQLEFKKQNGLYEVEFEVTGDFNLHLERKNYGRVELYQKTSSETNYTSSPSYSANGDAIINLDFSMGVYPKFVKIISYTEVEKAIVTMEGESGGSGSGGGLRPVTADDVALFLTQDQYYIDSEKIEFQDTITIKPYNKLFIKQLNPLTELAVLYTPNLTDNKMQANVWIPTKELFIYNNNSQNVDVNIKNVYIKD